LSVSQVNEADNEPSITWRRTQHLSVVTASATNQLTVSLLRPILLLPANGDI